MLCNFNNLDLNSYMWLLIVTILDSIGLEMSPRKTDKRIQLLDAFQRGKTCAHVHMCKSVCGMCYKWLVSGSSSAWQNMIGACLWNKADVNMSLWLCHLLAM